MFTQLIKPAGYLRPPFLFASIMMTFLIPQIYAIMRSDYLPELALQNFILMSILCFGAVLAGWAFGLRKGIPKRGIFTPELPEHSAVIGTLLITMIAVVTAFVLSGQDATTRAASGFEGRSAILHFFTNLKFVSLILSLTIFFTKRTLMTTGLVLINCALYFPVIFLLFRRRGIAEFAIALAFALYFARGIKIPRVAVITALVIGSLILFSVRELRDLNPDGGLPTFEQIAEIDFLNLTPLQDDTSSSEVEQGVMLVHMSDSLNYHTLGGQFRDRFVFQYVPATLVGVETKFGLMSDISPNQMMEDWFGYRAKRGATRTGVADAYIEFGYFGALFFFVLSYILGRFWCMAIYGNTWDKAYYAAAIIPGIITMTNNSAYFFYSYVLYFLALLGIAYFLSIHRLLSARSPHYSFQ